MKKGKLGKVVALGAVMGAGAWVYKKYDTIKSMYHKVSFFKGECYEFEEFDGEAIAAMFSGIVIDLSQAEFIDDEVYLDVYAFASGVRIIIPKNVEVVLEGTNKASGIQIDQEESEEKTHTLYINYRATVSGILITDNMEEGCCSQFDNCQNEDVDPDSDDEVADEVDEAIDDYVENEVPSDLEDDFFEQ